MFTNSAAKLMRETHKKSQLDFYMTESERKEWAVLQLQRKTKELGRLPNKADFDEYDVRCIKEALGPIPQGESVSDFKTRCCSAFEDIMKSIPDNSCVVFVVHGGVIMSVLEAYAHPKKGFYDYHIENGKNIFCQYDNCKRCFYIER